jgi:hypothetical protein
MLAAMSATAPAPVPDDKGPRPPEQHQLVPVLSGLEYLPGDETITDATTDEVCAWLEGTEPCPWPR